MERFTRIQLDEIIAKANVSLIDYTFAIGGVEYNIPHGLKRTPKKWIVCNLSANSVVYGTVDQVYLNLTASAPCSVTLEVV